MWLDVDLLDLCLPTGSKAPEISVITSHACNGEFAHCLYSFNLSVPSQTLSRSLNFLT